MKLPNYMSINTGMDVNDIMHLLIAARNSTLMLMPGITVLGADTRANPMPPPEFGALAFLLFGADVSDPDVTNKIVWIPQVTQSIDFAYCVYSMLSRCTVKTQLETELYNKAGAFLRALSHHNNNLRPRETASCFTVRNLRYWIPGIKHADGAPICHDSELIPVRITTSCPDDKLECDQITLPAEYNTMKIKSFIVPPLSLTDHCIKTVTECLGQDGIDDKLDAMSDRNHIINFPHGLRCLIHALAEELAPTPSTDLVEGDVAAVIPNLQHREI